MGYTANRRAQLGMNQQNTKPLSYSQRRKQELLNQQNIEKRQEEIETNRRQNRGKVIPQTVADFRKLDEQSNKPAKTPINQTITFGLDKSKDPHAIVGQSTIGMNIIPAYKEDPALAKVGKGIVNYGVGGVASLFNNIAGSPQQTVMQTVKNTGNAVQGKPLDFTNKTLRKDILPPEYDKALKDLYSKGTVGQYASEAIDMLVNAGLDPTTYIGGGIVDDMAKAGMMGEASKPSTKFVQVVGERQKALTSKTVKTAASGIDEVQDAITTSKTEQLAGESRGLSEKPTGAAETSKATGQVNSQPINKASQNGVQGLEPKTPKQQKYVDDYMAKLPNDEEGLKKVIADLETKAADERYKNILKHINLQLFGARKKLSQFKSNTIARATMLTDEEKAFLPDAEFKYTKEEGAQWEEAAKRNLAADTEGTKQKIIDSTQMSKEQEFEAAIIAKDLRDKARKIKAETGSDEGYNDLSKWLSQTSARTREDARALKAVDLAWDKASPEAGIKRAQKIVDGVEDAITKKDPAKMKKIDKGLQQIKEVLENPNLTPQEAVMHIKQIINPQGKAGKATMDKIIEIIDKGKAEGKIDYDGIKMVLKEKNGIPVLTNSELAQIDELYTKAKEYKPDSYEYRMYTEKARKLVEDKIPTDFIDRFRTLQRLSMIFNPKTLLTRNPGGNILLMTLTQIKENTLGAFSDYLLTAIKEKSLTKAFTSENRTTKFMPIAKAKASMQGVKKGAKEWAQDIKYGVDTNPTHGQMELGKSKVFKGDNAVSKTLNLLDTIEKRALQVGDRPFYEAAYASRVAELKRIRKVAELTDDMKIDAKAYALDKVFQRDSELSKIFGNAKNLSQNVGFKVLANTILPFSQTPANVLDKMLEYSPVGIGKAVREIAFPKNGVFNQKYFIDNLSSGLTGSGILVLGYYMYNQGMIKTKAPTSAKERSFEQVEGKGNFALNFNGKYYTIDWAQPVATMLLAGAEAAKGGTKGEGAFKKVLNSITAGGDTFFNMSLLKNVSSVFGSGASPMGSLINALMGSTTQLTPTMGKQISQLIDPYVRETYDPNMLKGQYNKILARLPWASKTLPVKRDMMGNEIKAYQGRNNLLNVMLNPGFYTEESKDPAVKEIRRLFDLEKNTDLLPGKEALTSGKFSKDKVDYTMTAKEFEQFSKTYGDVLQNGYRLPDGVKVPGLNALINTPVYKNLSDKAKTSRVKRIYDKAYEQAQKEFFKGRGIKP